MATSNTDSQREAIFNRLDELFAGGDSFSTPATDSTDTSHEQNSSAKTIAGSTVDKAYHILSASSNVTSYSKLNHLHTCPRLYELEMLSKTSNSGALGVSVELVEGQENLDFAYGHSVGAGIQTFAATGNLQAAQFAAFLAWRAPYSAVKLDKAGRDTGKSLNWALYAIEKFEFFWRQNLSEWEVLTLPSGKQAVELAFAVDTQNGFYHVGHIDCVLQNRVSKRLAVWEGKTTGLASVREATYGNSYQALGYSVVVDAISAQLGLPSSDYDVFYVVYSSKEKQFQLMPFHKSLSQRAEWLQDLLLNHAMITKYTELGFFPKRGESCVNKYGRQCEWYGSCQMRNNSLFPGVQPRKIENVKELEEFDYTFTLDELINAQKLGV